MMQLKRTLAALLAVCLLAFGALAVYRLRSGPPLPSGARADRILVLKGERTLVLLRDGKGLKRYRVALGPTPRGPKQRQSDGRTQESR